ncbi:piezo-type mechanosensitive ion channel component 2-like, partial [Ctenocephalides felis]|uniref:piezo-type mechanosensitive ion channel component 2-like n=1 Tax=Ctenocephalides felis TaxID=7515 RepID=UPI000E6E4C52
MPEVLTFVGCFLMYLSVVKLSKQGPADTNPLLPLDAETGADRGSGDGAATAEIGIGASLHSDMHSGKSNEKIKRFLAQLGKYMLLAFLCIAGSMRPSIPNSVYFLTFLASATWWSCCRSLGRKFALSCRLFVAPLLIVHIVVLYLYQLQMFQDLLPPSVKWTRYFGITQLFTWNCQNPRIITILDVEWASFVNPVALYLLYYTMILETKVLLKPQRERKLSKLDAGSFSGSLTRQVSARLSRAKLVRSTSDSAKTTTDKWRTATTKLRLIRGVSPGRRYMKQTSTTQEAVGTTNSEVPEENIQMQDMNETVEEDGTLLEQIILAIVSIFQVIIMSSYIFTNIIMM